MSNRGYHGTRGRVSRPKSNRPTERSTGEPKVEKTNSSTRLNPFQSGGRVTLFGRKPVLEALSDPRLTSQKLFIAHQARGELISDIIRQAEEIALPIHRLSSLELSRISKHSKQDQGVALDVQAPLHQALTERLKTPLPDRPIFLIDGLNNPANLGLLVRSVWASGAAGIILPQRGCAPLNPLAIKASAGVAIHAPIWTCESAVDAVELLLKHQIPLFGLAGEASHSLYGFQSPQKAVWVVGNETDGMGQDIRAHLTASVSLPMFNHVESLNAAVATSVVAFELLRQRLAKEATPHA